MPPTTSTAASAPKSVAAARRPAMTLSRSLSCRPTVSERGITLTFASGAQVDLLDEEADWLRDELVRGEYTSPTRDACRSSVSEAYLKTQPLGLPLCITCGRIGYCDSSPDKSATAHFREVGHPIMRSAELGEDWSSCSVDQVAFALARG